MKIEIAAKDAKTAIEFARNELNIDGQLCLGKIGEARYWHGDLLPVKADRGEKRNIYTVRVEPQNQIQENVQYVL